jgi:hypothetical protein
MLDGAFTSPKIRRLAVVLGVPWPHALGLARPPLAVLGQARTDRRDRPPRRRGDRRRPRVAGRGLRSGRRPGPVPPPRSDRIRRETARPRLARACSALRFGHPEAAEIAVFGGVSTIDYSRHYSPRCSPHYSRDYLYLHLLLHLLRLRLRCAENNPGRRTHKTVGARTSVHPEPRGRPTWRSSCLDGRGLV